MCLMFIPLLLVATLVNYYTRLIIVCTLFHKVLWQLEQLILNFRHNWCWNETEVE